MSIKIERLSLEEGEHIFIRFAGSVEHSVCIAWKKGDELPTISGPFSCKCRIFSVGIYGMEEIKRKS